jgi:hypothetical protein
MFEFKLSSFMQSLLKMRLLYISILLLIKPTFYTIEDYVLVDVYSWAH